MLHFISWWAFIKTILVVGGLYYAVIGLLYFRMEIKGMFRQRAPPS